jgi:CO dehydrogenase/acetyl-CoA synthase beta subunit
LTVINVDTNGKNSLRRRSKFKEVVAPLEEEEGEEEEEEEEEKKKKKKNKSSVLQSSGAQRLFDHPVLSLSHQFTVLFVKLILCV